MPWVTAHVVFMCFFVFLDSQIIFFIYVEYTEDFSMEQDEQMKHLLPTRDYGERLSPNPTNSTSSLEPR